jgi:hypothetical protein
MKQWWLLPVVLAAGSAMACPGMKEKDASVATPAAVAATSGTVDRLAQKAPAAKPAAEKAAKAAPQGQRVTAPATAQAEARKATGV